MSSNEQLTKILEGLDEVMGVSAPAAPAAAVEQAATRAAATATVAGIATEAVVGAVAGKEELPIEKLLERFNDPQERVNLTGEELHRLMIEGRANPGLLDDELLGRWSQYQWQQSGEVGVEFRAGYDFDYERFWYHQQELRNRQRAEMEHDEAGKMGGKKKGVLEKVKERLPKVDREKWGRRVEGVKGLRPRVPEGVQRWGEERKEKKRAEDWNRQERVRVRQEVMADRAAEMSNEGLLKIIKDEQTGIGRPATQAEINLALEKNLISDEELSTLQRARREGPEAKDVEPLSARQVEELKNLGLYLAQRTRFVNLGLFAYSLWRARQSGRPVGSVHEGLSRRWQSFKTEFEELWGEGKTGKSAVFIGIGLGVASLAAGEGVYNLIPIPVVNDLARAGVRDLNFLIMTLLGAGITRLPEAVARLRGEEITSEQTARGERLSTWIDNMFLAAAWTRTGAGLARGGLGLARFASEHFDLPSVTFGQAPATAGGRIGEIGRAEGPIRPIGEIGGGRAAQEGMRMGEATTRVAATATSIATVMPTATATETVIPTGTRVPTETPEATPTAAPEVQSYSTPEVEGGPELPEELRGKAVFTGKVNDVSDGWRAYGVDDIGKEGGPPEHMIFVNNGQELVYDRTDLTYGQLHPEAEVAAGVKDDHIYRQGNEFVRIDDNGRTHFVGLDSDNDSKLDEIMAVDKDGTFIDHPDKNIGIVWQKVNPDAGYRVDQGHFYQYDLKGNEELVGIRVEGEPAWMVAADKLPAEITSQFGRDLYLGPDGLYEPGFIRVALVTEGTTLENLTDTRIRAVWEMSVKNVHSLTWFREREIEGDGKQWFVDQNGQRIAFENVNAPADFRPIVYAEYEGVRPGYDLNRDGVIEPTEGEWKEGVWHVKLPDGTEYVDKNGDGILEKAGEKVAETTPEPLPQAEEEGVRPIRPIGRIGPIGERGEEAGSAEEPAGAAVPAEQPPTEAEPVAEAVKVEKPEEWVSEKFGRLRIGATGGFQGKVMEEMLGGDRGWVTAETYTPNQLAGAADYVWKEVAKIKGLTEAPIVRDGQTPAGLAEMEQKDLEDLYRKALAWAKKEM